MKYVTRFSTNATIAAPTLKIANATIATAIAAIVDFYLFEY